MKEKVHFLLSLAISSRLRALSSNFSAVNFSAANFSAASLRSVVLSDKRVEFPYSLNSHAVDTTHPSSLPMRKSMPALDIVLRQDVLSTLSGNESLRKFLSGRICFSAVSKARYNSGAEQHKQSPSILVTNEVQTRAPFS